MATPRDRHYLCTWNNPTIGLDDLLAKAKAHRAVAFRGQLEKGTEGTPHFQFYLQYAHCKTHMQVRRQWPGCHILACKDPRSSWDYCGKDETREEGPVEYGKAPKPKAKPIKSTVQFNQECVNEGAEALVADGRLHLRDYMKVKQAVSLYKLTTEPVADLNKLDNLWIWGKSGVGKSSLARQLFPDLFNKPLNKWWDGYSCQETVLLDDMDPNHKVLSHHLKKWADHYAFVGEVKGGHTNVRPRRIVVTSQYPIEKVFPDDPETQAAIRRRFRVHHLNGDPFQLHIERDIHPEMFADETLLNQSLEALSLED